MNLFYGFLALASGVIVAAQAAINTRLSIGIGNQPLLASLISFVVGSLCLLAVCLVQADWHALAGNIGQQPWWRWSGGLIGACFVTVLILLAPRIGLTNTMFLIIIGQLSSSLLIDHFGLLEMPLRPVHWWKLAGLGIMLCGLVLFIFGERIFAES